jgi:hypothetical protein
MDRSCGPTNATRQSALRTQPDQVDESFKQLVVHAETISGGHNTGQVTVSLEFGATSYLSGPAGLARGKPSNNYMELEILELANQRNTNKTAL